VTAGVCRYCGETLAVNKCNESAYTICRQISPMDVYGKPPLPLSPTPATPRPAAPLTSPAPPCLLPNRCPKKLPPSRYHTRPTLTTSRAKISPNPSITPLMNGRIKLIPKTAITRLKDRCPGMVNSERVSDGGAAGGGFCWSGCFERGWGTLTMSPDSCDSCDVEDGGETSSHACEVAECRDNAAESVGAGCEGDEVLVMEGGRGSVDVVGSYAVCASAPPNANRGDQLTCLTGGRD